MAGLCSYNFTVGFRPKNPDIVSDGQNGLKGEVGDYFFKCNFLFVTKKIC